MRSSQSLQHTGSNQWDIDLVVANEGNALTPELASPRYRIQRRSVLLDEIEIDPSEAADFVAEIAHHSQRFLDNQRQNYRRASHDYHAPIVKLRDLVSEDAKVAQATGANSCTVG